MLKMKKILSGLWMIALLTGITATCCPAETAYVSDLLILTFREGPGTNYAVIKTLKSNTPLKILQEDQGFYKVSLDSGEQGWVDKQFIMFDLPKTMIIDQLNREKSTLEGQIKKLKETSDRFKKASSERDTLAQGKAAGLAKQVADLEQKNQQLALALKESNIELSTLKQASKNVTGILNNNKRLTAENKELAKTIERLENDTRNMFRTGMIKWFLAGFGVLLSGWIIGKSVSSKRRGGSSLLD